MKFHGAFLILAAISILFVSCAEEVTNPPEEKIAYAIADYFPLEIGNEWTWQVHSRDSIPEPYRDGDSCLGEPFTDVNGNGMYDLGIDIFISDCGSPLNQDFNCNGGWDGPDDCNQTSPGIGAFVDFDGDSVFDEMNYQYDLGEPYLDFNDNGIRDYTNDYDLRMAVSHSVISYYDGTSYMMLSDSAIVEGFENYEIYYRNGFSVDSLGLRWHYHRSFTGYGNILYKPIQIAAESLQVGDNYLYTYVDYWTADTFTWISTLTGVEDVAVPAGTFTDCLKFRFHSSGWTGSMAELNGTSYWWLSKDVGLVKVEGPETELWVLKEYDLK